jgi:hypothetical protein
MENSKKKIYSLLDIFCSLIWTVEQLGLRAVGCWPVFVTTMACIVRSLSRIFLLRQKFSDFCRLTTLRRNVDYFTKSLQPVGYALTQFTHPSSRYTLQNNRRIHVLRCRFENPNCHKNIISSLARVLWASGEVGRRGAWTGREEGKEC